jgi:hypothetical protein
MLEQPAESVINVVGLAMGELGCRISTKEPA